MGVGLTILGIGVLGDGKGDEGAEVGVKGVVGLVGEKLCLAECEL